MYIFNFCVNSLIIIIISGLVKTDTAKERRIRCANEQCTVPISNVKTLHPYIPNEKSKIQLEKGVNVTVHGKSPDEWLVKYNGKCGFAPANTFGKKMEKIIYKKELIDVVWDSGKCVATEDDRKDAKSNDTITESSSSVVQNDSNVDNRNDDLANQSHEWRSSIVSNKTTKILHSDVKTEPSNVGQRLLNTIPPFVGKGITDDTASIADRSVELGNRGRNVSDEDIADETEEECLDANENSACVCVVRDGKIGRLKTSTSLDLYKSLFKYDKKAIARSEQRDDSPQLVDNTNNDTSSFVNSKTVDAGNANELKKIKIKDTNNVNDNAAVILNATDSRNDDVTVDDEINNNLENYTTNNQNDSKIKDDAKVGENISTINNKPIADNETAQSFTGERVTNGQTESDVRIQNGDSVDEKENNVTLASERATNSEEESGVEVENEESFDENQNNSTLTDEQSKSLSDEASKSVLQESKRPWSDEKLKSEIKSESPLRQIYTPQKKLGNLANYDTNEKNMVNGIKYNDQPYNRSVHSNEADPKNRNILQEEDEEDKPKSTPNTTKSSGNGEVASDKVENVTISSDTNVAKMTTISDEGLEANAISSGDPKIISPIDESKSDKESIDGKTSVDENTRYERAEDIKNTRYDVDGDIEKRDNASDEENTDDGNDTTSNEDDGNDTTSSEDDGNDTTLSEVDSTNNLIDNIELTNDSQPSDVETKSADRVNDDNYLITLFYFWMDELKKYAYIYLNSLNSLYEYSTSKLSDIIELSMNNWKPDSSSHDARSIDEELVCPIRKDAAISSKEMDDGVNYNDMHDRCVQEQRNDDSVIQEDMKSSHMLESESSWNDRSLFISWNYYIYTAFVTCVIFIFSTLYHYLQKKSYDYKLVTRINELESRLFLLNKEIVSLEQKNQHTIIEQKRDNLDNLQCHDDFVEENEEVEKLRSVNAQLDNKVSYLEGELERVTASALEIHQLLENALSFQQENKALEEKIQNLTAESEKREQNIDSLKNENENLRLENELLKRDNDSMINRVEKLRAEHNVESKQNKQLTEKCDALQSQLSEELNAFSKKEANYKAEIAQLRKTVCNLELSLKKSETVMDRLNGLVDNKKVTDEGSAGEYIQLKTQLAALNKYNDELCQQLSGEKSARLSLVDTVQEVSSQMKQWREKYDTLENEKRELDVKLQVLTDYFNEKENTFRKEMESKDSMWSKKQNDQVLLSHKFSLLQSEMDIIKAQNEDLKKEILEQEKSFKVQLANEEQKSRERWFALRQTERKYKECEQEAAALRNKLLLLQSNMSAASSNNEITTPANNSVGFVNGVVGGSSAAEYYHQHHNPNHNSNNKRRDLYGATEFLPPPPLTNDNDDDDDADVAEIFLPEPLPLLYSPERLSPLGGRRPPSPPPPLIADDEHDYLPPPPRHSNSRNTAIDSLSSLSTYRSTSPPIGRRKNPYSSSSRHHRGIDHDSLSSGMSETSLDKEIR